jgi:type VI secretion system protein ImpC
MPDPIRPGHVSFDISFKKTAPPTPVDEDAPLRMAILGHFSGRADAAGSRPLRVDCDNFDSVCAQFAASLHLPACAGGTAEIDLAFKHLDDFHPDQLLKSVPALATLSDLRARLLHPGSTEAAVAELRGIFKTGTPASASITPGAPQQESAADMVARLLGRPVTGPSAPAGPKSIVDQLIKQAVAPSTAPPPSPEQASLLATLDSEISARLRRILHHPDFQALESTWRGLDFLVRGAGENVKLHAIDISREELDRQISSLDNPAASAVGRQLEPLVPAVILGAFTFGTRDPGTLLRIARLAEACSTAFIGGAKPELLDDHQSRSERLRRAAPRTLVHSDRSRAAAFPDPPAIRQATPSRHSHLKN